MEHTQDAVERTEDHGKQLRVNGTWTTTHAATVAALLESLGMDPARHGIAVAVNETVVPRTKWAVTELQDGDTVELLRAVQGG